MFPVVLVIGIAILLFGVLDGVSSTAPPPKKSAPPPALTPNTTPGQFHAGLKIGDIIDTRLSTSYDDHDVAGDAGNDPVFCFADEAQPGGTGPDGPIYNFSSDIDSDGGKSFRRLFLRHVYFPAARVELSQDVGIQHVAGAISLLKGFSSDPRVSNYTQADPAVADATAVVQSVIKDIPVAGGIANLLFSVGNAEIVKAFNDQNKAWFNSWADIYQPPDPTDFLTPSGDGGNAELPLPPANVFGGGGGRVDAQWWFASGPAMWKRDPGKWVCDNPDPVFGCPPGSGTYVPGQGVISSVPWVLTADEIPADLAGRFKAGQTIYVRARLFSVSPTLGIMILPWKFIGGQTAPIRDRINLAARLYRLIDAMACITWSGWHAPATYDYTDPKLGPMKSSIFPATPLQTPALGAIKANAPSPAALLGAINQMTNPGFAPQTDSVTIATPTPTAVAAPAQVAAVAAAPTPAPVVTITQPAPSPVPIAPTPAPAPTVTAPAPVATIAAVAPAPVPTAPAPAPAPTVTAPAPTTTTAITTVAAPAPAPTVLHAGFTSVLY